MPSMVASPSRCSSAGTNTTEARKWRAMSAGSTELVSSEASTTSVRSASWNLTIAPTAWASSTARRTSSITGTFLSTVRPLSTSSEAAIIFSAAFLAPCTKTVPCSGWPPRTRYRVSGRVVIVLVLLSVERAASLSWPADCIPVASGQPDGRPPDSRQPDSGVVQYSTALEPPRP